MLKMIQDQQEKVKGQNLDELVVTSAKQMGKELFAHLDVDDRKQKLDSMVCHSLFIYSIVNLVMELNLRKERNIFIQRCIQHRVIWHQIYGK